MSKQGMSDAGKIALGVGLGVGGAVLLLGIFFMVWMARFMSKVTGQGASL